MRASRLLSIQMLLETRGGMSAEALARELEVSVRTVHRDIDRLAASGVPIYADRGRTGGFKLLEGWKTTLTGFTAAESQAVFLSGLAGPASALGLGQEVIDAQLKLAVALPPTQRGSARMLQERFHLDTVDWYREADPVPHLKSVAAAVWGEKQIAIRYESWKGFSRQTLSPLGLVLKSGAWYLVAARESMPRTYRVSNILELTVREERAIRPKKFDLASYWTESVERFENELHATKATVLATAAGIKQLRQLSAPIAKAIASASANSDVAPRTARQKERSPSDERTRLTIPVEATEQATAQLARLAPEVEVLAPKELREAVIQRLKAGLSRYAKA
jgi:predicted DNA-binding transcriptional regulator YafY